MGIRHELIKIFAKQNLNRRLIKEWLPDSIYRKNGYPEIQYLYDLWCKDNEENNCLDFCRFYSLVLNIDMTLASSPGAIAELGVYKGNSASILKYFADKYDVALYLYDTFEGFDARDLHGVDERQCEGFIDTSLSYVKKRIGEAYYREGYFPESIEDSDRNVEYSFVSLDCDLHDPMLAGLEFFWPRMVKGGKIFCHDYSSGYWMGCKQAIDDFCKKENVHPLLLSDIGGTAVLVK